MNTTNYGLILSKTLETLTKEGRRPRLLLHACCAPCSSYVLEYLTAHFEITLFFYNPNISPEEEYDFRCRELVRLVEECGYTDVAIIRASYTPSDFDAIAAGMTEETEGGARCYRCYRLRLCKTAEEAKAGAFDYFTTTLSISPHKNAQWLNEIGGELEKVYGVPYLYSDFKKKGGYQRSIVLSREHHLYRQDYCGCVYSKAARERQKQMENK